MKKYLKFIIIAASVMAVACSKESGQEVADEQRGTINVCIDGEINGYSADEDTKAVAETIVRVRWTGAADEYVYAFDANKCLGRLETSIEGTGGSYAKLTGTIENTSASKITLVYSPQFNGEPTIDEGKISLDLSSQSGENVPFLVYGVLDKTSALNNAKVDFTLATSVYKFNCANLPSDGEFVKAQIGEVNTVCELTINSDAAPAVRGTTPGIITRYREGLNLPSQPDQRAIFQIAIAPTDATTSRTISVYKGDQLAKAAFSATKFLSAKAYNSVFMFKALPAGALPGEFSVSPTKKVNFSKGNLRYTLATENWSFFDHQYDCGPDSYAAGHDIEISLFTWGYNATKSIIPDGSAPDNVDIISGTLSQEQDWGCRIGDGNTWRTLTNAEWVYLFNTRTDASEKVGYAKVNNVNGIIILPDTFTDPMKNGGSNAFVPKSTPSWATNVYTGGNWEAMEDAGAVFLPSAGCRTNAGNEVKRVVSYGYYWSSTAIDNNKVYCAYFDSGTVTPDYSGQRNNATSVRLITESK